MFTASPCLVFISPSIMLCETRKGSESDWIKTIKEKALMLSMGEERRKGGRPRINWMDGIRDLTGLNLAEMREAVRE